MNEENAQVIYDLLDRIKVTDENRDKMEKIRKFLSESKFQEALDELQILQMSGNIEYEDYAEVFNLPTFLDKKYFQWFIKYIIETRNVEEIYTVAEYKNLEVLNVAKELKYKENHFKYELKILIYKVKHTLLGRAIRKFVRTLK